jgi:hypothetical protein
MVSLKKKLKRLLSDSTAFGLPNIFKREGFLNKIFWLIFSLLATSVSVYYTLDALNYFFNYNFVTQIENVYQQPLQFPTITICDDGTKTNEKFENVEYFNGKNPENFIKQFKTMKDTTNFTNNQNYFFEMLRYINTGDYGTCLRFNSGKNVYNQTIPFFYSTIGGPNDYIEIIFKDSLRLKIFLHDVDLPPNIQYYNIFEPYILINFNLSYYIGIDKSTENKLGLPYNHCYNDVTDFNLNKTIIDYIKSINQTYTQVNCLKLCFELDYIEKNPCNCSNTTLGRVWRDCYIRKEVFDQNGCTYKYRRNFFEKSIVEKCANYCPLECNSTTYTFSSSSTYNVFHKNTTAVRFFYNSLKVTKISQIPKTQIFDLVSNVGGIFSLFIGFSFVTLFEISEIFIVIAFSLFQSNNRVEKIVNENEKLKNEIRSEVKNQLKIELDKSLKLNRNLLELKQKTQHEQMI